MRDPQLPRPHLGQLGQHPPGDLDPSVSNPPAAQGRQGLPGVIYQGGIPYYVPQQQYVVQLPGQLPGQQDNQTVSPWVRDLVVISVVLLVVLVVCCACVIAVVVMAGGTLMGIIGAAASAAVPVTVGLVATLVALGWAATRVRALTGQKGQKGKH